MANQSPTVSSKDLVRDPAARQRANELLLLAILASVIMLFAGFTSAYVIRRAGVDWQRAPLPSVLWVNTLVLLARRQQRQ